MDQEFNPPPPTIEYLSTTKKDFSKGECGFYWKLHVEGVLLSTIILHLFMNLFRIGPFYRFQFFYGIIFCPLYLLNKDLLS